LLFQGDIIDNFEFAIGYEEDAKNGTTKVKTITRDVIILSNTCDMILERPKLRNILISPLTAISEFEKQNPIYSSSNFKEAVRRGFIRNFFILAEVDFKEIKKEPCIINFREIFFTKIEVIRNHAEQQGKRIRLKNPYREGFSQAFAKFIMYVGYPEEIPYFKKTVEVSKFEDNL